MTKINEKGLDDLVRRYPRLSTVRDAIIKTVDALVNCYTGGGTILVCGNGGSAADAEHIVGELMKGFVLNREMDSSLADKMRGVAGADADILIQGLQNGIPAISLVSQVSLMTAVANDNGADLVFAQQVYGYGKPGDVLIGISTSGNARNVALALKTARAMGVITVGLTGRDGGAMKGLCDILVAVPADGSHYVQELHVPVYHAMCLMVEERLFGK